MIEDLGLRVPMRDGACLVTDVCRPEGTGPWPVLLLRTPYGRAAVVPAAERERLVGAGFAVVAQDCRGCFESEGEWSYVRGEVDDGYDAVEWAAAQPWSDGRVGMFGASYMGSAQWMAAIARPPHLVAIAPECCPADSWTASFEPGGVFRLALRVGWASSFAASMASHWGLRDERLAAVHRASTQRYEALARGDRDGALAAGAAARPVLHGIYRTRPLRDVASWHGRSRVLEEVFDHERRADAHWRRTNPASHYDVLDLPAVHVAGWFDVHLAGTLEHFAQMRRQAPTGRARRAQRLVVGPWAHWDPQDHLVGDADFGAAAALDTVQLRVDWFRHWLQDGPDPGWAPVRIFVMGDHAWRDEQEWPPARARATPWHLREGGRLDPAPPGGGEQPDGYTFDPRTPVPTVGGRLLALGEVAGPRRQPPAGSRPDVLAYASAPLGEPLEVTGPVLVDLWVSTDAPDTDFTAALLDVHPDGSTWNVCEGAVRMRHALATPPAPGAVHHLVVDLAATSIVFGAGHRLEVRVSSSSFPAWEPNPNTGHPLGTDADGDLRPARQQVFHDARHPSRVVLPVVPR